MAQDTPSFAERGALGGAENARRRRKELERRDVAIAAAEGTYREIGARFGVSHEIVRRIKNRLGPKRAA